MACSARSQLGIGLAHLGDQGRRQAVHQGIGRAQEVRVAHGAAHDPAQHIAPALVGRRHPVGDQEARRAQVVGDHPVRGAVGGAACPAHQVAAGGDERPEEVDVVVVVHPLQDRGDPLQAHAGVDGGLGQVDPLVLGQLLVLHEDQVPDLHEPVAVLVRATGRAAGDVGAVVVEDLRTGAARAGVTHRPEIVGGGDADDPVVGDAGNLLPEDRRLLVVGVDGDQELIGGKRELLGQQLPGVFDRAGLEVVAEGEIPSISKKAVVAACSRRCPGRACRRADGFLRRGRARPGAASAPGSSL